MTARATRAATVEVTMPAHRARSRLDHRVTSDRTLVETAGRAGPSTVTEVMTMERALKQALVPLASAALDREVDLVCEVLSDVGEYVLGDRRGFMDLVGRAVAPALARAVRGEVRVRLARQYAGFAPTDTVLVSVSIGHEGARDVEDVEDVEIMLPIAQRLDEVEAARELAGLRVLLVVPSLHLSRVHSAAVRRFGALVEAVCDVQPACLGTS